MSRQDGESMQEFANKVQEVKSDFVAKGIYLFTLIIEESKVEEMNVKQ